MDKFIVRQKYIEAMDDFLGNTYEGITHLHIRKFLTEWKA